VPDQATIATSIVNRLARHFSTELTVSSVNLDESLFSEQGFSLGDRGLDSLDLVEAIAILEEELHIVLLDQDLSGLDTINLVAQFVSVNAELENLEAFCGRWGIS
jgi:acyl carrier protein